MLRRTVSVSRVQFELGAQNETFFVSEFAFHLQLFYFNADANQGCHKCMVLRFRLEFPSAPHANVTRFRYSAPPTKRLLFHPADARNHAPS